MWPEAGKAKVSLQVRQAAEKEILRLRNRTGLPLKTLLGYAGIPADMA